MTDFNDEDYWRSIIIYGLNQATYKIALGKTLVSLSERNINHVPWDVLSLEFLEQYQKRLNVEEPMPQQANRQNSRRNVHTEGVGQQAAGSA